MCRQVAKEMYVGTFGVDGVFVDDVNRISLSFLV